MRFNSVSDSLCVQAFCWKPASEFANLSCDISEECGYTYGDDGYIVYTVTETGPNTYLISGKVDLHMQVVGGMYPKLSFYVIFMDDEMVQHERRVRTGTTKATFEFETTVPKPVSKTTIEKMVYMTRS